VQSDQRDWEARTRMWEAVRPVSANEASMQEPDAARGVTRLLELQGVDLAIDRHQSRLAALETGEEVRALRTEAQAAEGLVGELKLALDAVTREQRRLEGDVDSMEQKIEAERKRMFDGSVVNPKELQSIAAEVESLQHRKSRTEDAILEQMEQREQLEGRLGPMESGVEEARRRLEEVEETSGRELVEIEADLKARMEEREALARGIDEELLELYEDLRRSKKGVGVALLIDGVCQGCHQQLSAVYLDRLKRAEGIRRCEYCRRIVTFA
jgi:predicted  nucleic acid-binding Zn-ribbon protein